MTYRKLDPEKMRVIGMTFLFLHEDMPEGEVNMMRTKFHPCGTVACHAGWFALARGLKSTCEYGYSDSASDMAKYLGFEDRASLEKYFFEDEALWGNPDADGMFCFWAAFGGSRAELTLETIGLHWLQVADRVEAENERRGLA